MDTQSSPDNIKNKSNYEYSNLLMENIKFNMGTT